MSHALYAMTAPSRWVVPERFSHSSLAQIAHCPLQWQLSRSPWGEHPEFPGRPAPAAVEGDIVHGTLDQLFRALSLAGCPPLGSPAFQEALRAFDLRAVIERRVADHQQAVRAHPRGAGFSLRRSPRELQNQVIAFFREQYGKLDASQALPAAPAAPERPPADVPLARLLRLRGALSEIHLQHPTLPFHGFIDLVWLDQGRAVILDFKTGKAQDHHREQVRQYAALWWRCAGEAPARVEIRYPGDLYAEDLDEPALHRIEADLQRKLSQAAEALAAPPARPSPGDHCRLCDVRPFCDAFWQRQPSLARRKDAGRGLDLELTVESEATEFGFEARTMQGEALPVVYAQGGLLLHGPFPRGQRLRVLNGLLDEDGASLQLTERSEVFRRP